jgi:hypothetical protein
MVEDDVENHVHSQFVRRINKGPELIVRLVRLVREVSLGPDEIVDAISVVDLGEGEMQVIEYRAEPDCAHAEVLQIRKLFPNTAVSPALVAAEPAIERRVQRTSCGIIEAVHHQEIDPLIAPVDRGRVR